MLDPFLTTFVSTMADASELANTLFPPPPPFYKEFTDANLARYAELRGEPSGTSKNRASSPISADTPELRDLESKLERPRADWIVEEGRWMCFGQQYDVEPRIPSLEQIGLTRWIDPNEPPHTSLPPLLHSFLHTFLLLLDTLTNTARIPGELEEKGWQHEGDQYIQHMSNLAATMMVASNQLRDVQVRKTSRLN
ncbi:hypothetical protein BD324DRAFT_444141 [Kockovaella imperatae]|uniref:Mediator of RNA polymerase II transcription subunit 7 n=1 Tax=Kockovaella imperatae TaxID=4999 RepID=A0A1Y1UIH8_9TREE|nr:hypothetical protein BD324DRAFT_444141 [Kockovaella imperatae]ORX37357.1 hypothetical protein BD324DRAFT_444141 [Kockovaella imperatae]